MKSIFTNSLIYRKSFIPYNIFINMDSTISKENKLMIIQELERKFQLACKQVLLLNNMYEKLQQRHKIAKQFENNTIGFNIRLQLTTLEEVRSAYYKYCFEKADILDNMFTQMVENGEIDETDETDDQ